MRETSDWSVPFWEDSTVSLTLEVWLRGPEAMGERRPTRLEGFSEAVS